MNTRTRPAPPRRRPGKRPAALATALLATLALAAPACDDGGGEDLPIPIGHPCPDQAYTPEVAATWEDAALSGDPVPLTLLVPFGAGDNITVTQGTQQPPTHTGTQQWAIDFDAPVGTTVRAAAPGVVTLVRDDSTRSGPDATFREDANYVTIDHGGGLYTAYVHLAAGSARVQPGQVVAAGTALADTGLSGQLSGPHLHFQVENIWSESLPARFVSRTQPFTCTRAPALDDGTFRPTGLARTLVGPDTPAMIPTDAFADQGVRKVEGLPARLWRLGETFRLTGEVGPGVRTVFMLVLPEEGGDALWTGKISVSPNGFFAVDVTPGAAGAGAVNALSPGRYGWAMAGTADDSVTVPRSIRMTILP